MVKSCQIQTINANRQNLQVRFPSPLSHQRLGSWSMLKPCVYYQLQLSLWYESSKSTHSWWCKFVNLRHWKLKHKIILRVIDTHSNLRFRTHVKLRSSCVSEWPPQLLQWKTMRGLGMRLSKFHIQSFKQQIGARLTAPNSLQHFWRSRDQMEKAPGQFNQSNHFDSFNSTLATIGTLLDTAKIQSEPRQNPHQKDSLLAHKLQPGLNFSASK